MIRLLLLGLLVVAVPAGISGCKSTPEQLQRFGEAVDTVSAAAERAKANIDVEGVVGGGGSIDLNQIFGVTLPGQVKARISARYGDDPVEQLVALLTALRDARMLQLEAAPQQPATDDGE